MSDTAVKQAPAPVTTAPRISHIPRQPYTEVGSPAVVGLCGYRPAHAPRIYRAAPGEDAACVVCSDLWKAGER